MMRPSIFIYKIICPLQEERERQINAMKERVARVKYERTQTMKERGATTSRQFDELVSDAGAGRIKMCFFYC